MNPFDPIDALLATADIPLPAARERRRLRQALRLETEPVAQALGITANTLNAWEQGSEPAGTVRVHYAYFLSKARMLAPTETSHPHPHPSTRPPTASPARPAPRHSPRTAAADPIIDTVSAALDYYGGDRGKAAEELVKRAIPHAMRLFNQTRVGARYDVVAYPPLPDIFSRSSPDTSDQIWEARPNWERPGAGPTEAGPVAVLDINGAYLSALKTHLPLGALQHQTGAPHDRRRSGFYRITPPEWEHGAYLPNPLGHRLEPGPLWVTEPTLRLILQLSEGTAPLCDPPLIHESYTSGSTEGLLEKFRTLLRDARATALHHNDEVTLGYVKSMYSKFVSTMGDSTHNRELHRPDWMHIIRSQAFANLWRKAHNAHTDGLTVVRLCGTDELHVRGDWRRTFTEGTGLNEVKLKRTTEGGEEH
ncbi:transcriptional regulator [Streptomyces californicus]|uniref:transcriptional regulator n=1 Tax=Streptomyces californicus TaxID=67351 RepID=UPI003694C6E0